MKQPDEQAQPDTIDERPFVQWVGRLLIAAVSSIPRLVNLLFVICGVLALLDLGFIVFHWDKHAHFGWEDWPEFYGVYGFMSCALLVLASRFILRPLLMRKEDYYD